jgi:hypothetical protein
MEDSLVRSPVRREDPNAWYAADRAGFERHILAW